MAWATAMATVTGGGLAAAITCPAIRSKKVSSAVVVVASSSSKPIREGFPTCSASLSSRSDPPPNPALVPDVFVPQQASSFSAAKSKPIQFPPTSPMFTAGEDGKCSLLVVGLNNETAPSAMHAKLAFPSEEYPCVIEQLSGLSSIKEVGVLCSCERFEVYVVAQSSSLGIQQVTEWMSKRIDDSYELYQHIFVLRDDNAVRHLYEGMSSYDILNTHLAFKVLTLQRGQEVPGFGVILCELFISVFRVDKIFGVFPAKAPICSSAVTVAFSELHESSRQHPPSFLVIGADRTCKLVIQKLLFANYKKIVVLSDAVEQIGNFQEEFAGIGIIYRPMSQLLPSISEANVVFIGLGIPLFSKRDVDDLPPTDEEMGGTRIFIDLCNPFNFCLSGLGFASGHNIDDLFKFRQDKASRIHKESLRKAKRFMSWMETVLEDDGAYGDRAKNSQGFYAKWL